MFPEKCYLKKICKRIHAYNETSSVKVVLNQCRFKLFYCVSDALSGILQLYFLLQFCQILVHKENKLTS